MEKVTRERVIEELADIAFARFSDFYEWREGQPVLRGDLSGAAIATMEPGTHGVKLKLYDKLKALELLGKCVGVFGSPLPSEAAGNLLEAILQATEKEVQTDDIPELQQATAAGDDLVEPTEAAPV